MNIDPNIIIAIISVIALISPTISTAINLFYQNKHDNELNYELAKRESLINFIKSANDYKQHDNTINTSNLLSSIDNLYIYFANIPNEIHDLQNISSTSFDKSLNSITIELAKQLKKK